MYKVYTASKHWVYNSCWCQRKLNRDYNSCCLQIPFHPYECHPYNLYCVGGDVKPLSINQSIDNCSALLPAGCMSWLQEDCHWNSCHGSTHFLILSGPAMPPTTLLLLSCCSGLSPVPPMLASWRHSHSSDPVVWQSVVNSRTIQQCRLPFISTNTPATPYACFCCQHRMLWLHVYFPSTVSYKQSRCGRECLCKWTAYQIGKRHGLSMNTYVSTCPKPILPNACKYWAIRTAQYRYHSNPSTGVNVL